MLKKMLGCGLPIFWAGVIMFGYPGLMSTCWQEMYHVGSAETGLVVTCMLLALAVAMFISGRIHSRAGMGVCILIATALYLLAFAVLLTAESIRGVYLWGFIVSFGGSFIYGPGLTTVQQAYPEKKGLVSGAFNLTFGISAAIMSPLLNRMLEARGYVFVNVLMISAIVVTYLFSYALLRFSEKAQSAAARAGKDTDLTVTQALRTRDFWLIWLVWVFMGAAGISMVSLSRSYSAAIGAAGVALLTAFNLANGLSRIFVGAFSDRLGAKAIALGAYAITALAYFAMPHTGSVRAAALCAIGVGIGLGTLFTVTGPLAAELFGLTNFGMIFGLIYTAYGMVAAVMGPALSGMLLEKTGGSYLIVFSYLGVMAAIGMALMCFVKNPKAEK